MWGEMVVVVETGEFVRWASGLLEEAECEALIFYLSCHPEAGDLIRATGGLRKLRWGLGRRGKRGGARVIYYFHSELMPLYLLAVYTKGERADLSADDRRELRKLADQLRKANGL